MKMMELEYPYPVVISTEMKLMIFSLGQIMQIQGMLMLVELMSFMASVIFQLITLLTFTQFPLILQYMVVIRVQSLGGQSHVVI